MIQLTRLNEQPLAINSDLIKFVENKPDTVLTLINGEKILVRERAEQVIERIIQFRRAVLAGLPSAGANLGLSLSQPAQGLTPEDRQERDGAWNG